MITLENCNCNLEKLNELLTSFVPITDSSIIIIDIETKNTFFSVGQEIFNNSIDKKEVSPEIIYKEIRPVYKDIYNNICDFYNHRYLFGLAPIIVEEQLIAEVFILKNKPDLLNKNDHSYFINYINFLQKFLNCFFSSQKKCQDLVENCMEQHNVLAFEKNELQLAHNELKNEVDNIGSLFQKLSLSEKRLRNLFLNLNITIVIFEIVYDIDNNIIDYRYIDTNEHHELLTGLKSEDVKGQLFSKVYKIDTPPCINEVSEAVKTNSMFTYELDFKPIQKQLLISATVIDHKHIICALFDITKQKKLEKQLYETNNILQKQNEILKEKEQTLLLQQQELEIINSEILEYKNSLEKVFEDTAQSEKLFRNLFDNMREIVIIAEVINDDNGNAIDYKLIQINKAGEIQLKKNKESIIGNTARSLLGIENLPFINKLDQVIKTNQLQSFKGFYPPVNKHYEFIIFNLSHNRFGAIAHDLTEIKKAQQELELNKFAFDNASISIIWFSPEGKIVNYNDKSLKIYGYDANEFSNLSIYDLNPMVDKNDWPQLVNIIKHKELSNIETIHIKKDSSTIPVFITLKYLEYQGKEYLIAFINDVTEKKAAQKVLEDTLNRLKKSENKLMLTNHTVDFSSFAVFWVTKDAQIVKANKTAAKISGYSSEEFLKLTVFDLAEGYNNSNWPERWQNMKQAKSITVAMTAKHKNGYRIPSEITLNFIEFRGVEYAICYVKKIEDNEKQQYTIDRRIKKFKSKEILYEQETMKVLLELSDKNIIVLNTFGELIEINSSAQKLFNLPSLNTENKLISFDSIISSPDKWNKISDKLENSSSLALNIKLLNNKNNYLVKFNKIIQENGTLIISEISLNE